MPALHQNASRRGRLASLGALADTVAEAEAAAERCCAALDTVIACRTGRVSISRHLRGARDDAAEGPLREGKTARAKRAAHCPGIADDAAATVHDGAEAPPLSAEAVRDQVRSKVAKFDGPNADAITHRLLLAGTHYVELLTRSPDILKNFVELTQARLAEEAEFAAE